MRTLGTPVPSRYQNSSLLLRWRSHPSPPPELPRPAPHRLHQPTWTKTSKTISLSRTTSLPSHLNPPILRTAFPRYPWMGGEIARLRPYFRTAPQEHSLSLPHPPLLPNPPRRTNLTTSEMKKASSMGSFFPIPCRRRRCRRCWRTRRKG